METARTTDIRSLQRFYDEDREWIYNLFDAFIEKIVFENKAIDFSKGAIDYYGQVEFATLDDENGQPVSFSELLCGEKGNAGYKESAEYIIKAPVADLRKIL